jgi:hypothetical protein
MRLLKRILRPVYKLFFERPLWWFLAKVKAFFMAEITGQIGQMSRKLEVLEERLQAVEANREQRVFAVQANMEASNVAQWKAIEQLLLALLSQPEARVDTQSALGTLHHELAELPPKGTR